MRTYMGQAWARLRDPQAPEPELALLCDGSPPQFLYLHPDHEGAQAAIRYKVRQRKLAYSDRWIIPEGMLLIRGHVLYGGGVNIDANSTAPDGMSYPNIFGGAANHKVLRLLTDAPRGRLTKLEGGAPFRHQDPSTLHTVSEERVREAGQPVRSPFRGRETAIAESLRRFRLNAHRTDIGISGNEYEAFLREVYRLLDATAAALSA